MPRSDPVLCTGVGFLGGSVRHFAVWMVWHLMCKFMCALDCGFGPLTRHYHSLPYFRTPLPLLPPPYFPPLSALCPLPCFPTPLCPIYTPPPPYFHTPATTISATHLPNLPLPQHINPLPLLATFPAPAPQTCPYSPCPHVGPSFPILLPSFPIRPPYIPRFVPYFPLGL